MNIFRFISMAIAALVLTACSINRMATIAVADLLSGETGSVFSGDDDPKLVGDALPFALKMYEALLASVPDHQPLRIAAGSAFVMYAKAFVETEAVRLESVDYEEASKELERTKRLYARASAYLDGVVAEISPNWPAAAAEKDDIAAQNALALFKKKDVRLLYWTAASIMAAYALEPFNFELGARVYEAGKLMARAYELEPDYGNGTIDDFYISYYGSLPTSMGGDPVAAERHFELAVKKSKGKAVSPYVSAATALAIPRQDYEAFKRFLESALAIDCSADPANRTANVLAQERARALLSSAGDYFLIQDDTDFDFFDFEEDDTQNPVNNDEKADSE